MRNSHLLLGLCCVTILFGCSTTDIYSKTYINKSSLTAPSDPKFLIFPAKIDISYFDVLDRLELDSEKSASATQFYTEALTDYMLDRNISVTPYNAQTIRPAEKSILKTTTKIFKAVRSLNKGRESLGLSKVFRLAKGDVKTLSKYSADYLVVTDMNYKTPSAGLGSFGLLVNPAISASYLEYNIAVFDLRDGQCIWINTRPNNTSDDYFGFWEPNRNSWDRNIKIMFDEFSLEF